ncbi:MAG TPA: TIGR00725 family protein [Actinomycetota bacterium]|jgi:uncharacterized protein (TIGR00725 family)|nr:TIGR00725 family protein [Actinomycetota bacterium]
MSPIHVAVCGPALAGPAEFEAAEEVGRLLAEAGAIVVCGGGTGVMDAVARGCREAGGITVGLLADPDRADASEHLTVSIPTGMGETRNALVARSGQAVIAIGGEFGTLSEIALALKIGRPVVGLGTWEVAKPGYSSDPIVRVGSPTEAVRRALELASGL